MADQFNLSKFSEPSRVNGRYEKHISILRDKGLSSKCIEAAVTDAIHNILQENSQSFVIYGEPQSGKTEMMIALTAKLLDTGQRIVIHLMNDSIQLLGQNLARFKRSGLAPSPKSINELIAPDVDVSHGDWVIFCKKNSKDLQKLIDVFQNVDGKTIIDDEADFATPNSKVNRGEQTKINELIEQLLGDNGIYIGVTATPARLDLNNTYMNESDLWVNFPPHQNYTGQDIFFPIDSPTEYRLTFIDDHQHDDDGDIVEAILSFLVNASYLNMYGEQYENNYSMLIHTSGKKKSPHRSTNCGQSNI